MSLHTKTICSLANEPTLAVAEIAQTLKKADLKAVMLFVSSDYNLEDLGTALNYAFSIPVFGCTTAGHVGPEGFGNRGLQATGFYGDGINLVTEVIHPLEQCQSRVSDMEQRLRLNPSKARWNRFGLLFVDGLSFREERLAAALHHCFPDIPLVGGSAGDNLRFDATFVYANGRFHNNAAVLALFETETPVAAFKFQHFVPTQDILVVTEADAENRTVVEFNGEPAAVAYARLLGISVEELTPEVFSMSPLMIKMNSDYYVRSIQQCNQNLSLSFYCAIAKGIVLRIGKAVNPLQTAEEAFQNIQRSVPKPSLIIGCDCVLRRLEFEQTELKAQMGQIMADNRVVGFSTYGEQFNALHMNQTFTGLALGEQE